MTPVNHMWKHSLKRCSLQLVLKSRGVFEISQMWMHCWTEMWRCAPGGQVGSLARLDDDGLAALKRMPVQVTSLGGMEAKPNLIPLLAVDVVFLELELELELELGVGGLRRGLGSRFRGGFRRRSGGWTRRWLVEYTDLG